MSTRLVRSAALVTLAVSAAALPLSAQVFAASSTRSNPSISVTPYAGYMLFGDMLSGPLGTNLSSRNSAVYGAQLSVPLTSNIAIVGNVAHSTPGLQVGVPFLGGVSFGQSSLWAYDAALELSMPIGTATARPITPFVQVGGGAMKYAVNISGVNTDATNGALVLGAGADIPLSGNFGLRLMARDYVGKFDFTQATGLGVTGNTTHNFALSAGVKLSF
ncbi:MAG: porin family protein [Gemmatimonadota bacterium]|nr:porin family protein [Gemmatimonadota bacterium]